MRTFSSSNRGTHPIPQPPNRRNDVRSELLPQVSDVDVHDIGPRLEVVPPDMTEKLLAGQDLTLVGEERLEEQEFLGRQLHRPTGPLDASGTDVDDDVSEFVPFRFDVAGLTPVSY